MSTFEIISLIVQLLLGASAIMYLAEKLCWLCKICHRRIKFLWTPEDIKHGIIFIDPNFKLNLKWEKVTDVSILPIQYQQTQTIYYKIHIDLESYSSFSTLTLTIDGKPHEFNKLFISKTSILLVLNNDFICEFSPRYTLKNMVLAGKKLSPEQYLVIKPLKHHIKL